MSALLCTVPVDGPWARLSPTLNPGFSGASPAATADIAASTDGSKIQVSWLLGIPPVGPTLAPRLPGLPPRRSPRGFSPVTVAVTFWSVATFSWNFTCLAKLPAAPPGIGESGPLSEKALCSPSGMTSTRQIRKGRFERLFLLLHCMPQMLGSRCGGLEANAQAERKSEPYRSS